MKAGTAALAGWTNVGKSSLLNRLIGEKVAAVADASQTTRWPIRGVITLAGTAQVAFVDTPGLHAPKHRMNRAMVRGASRAIREVDVVVLVVDGHRGLGDGDRAAAAQLAEVGVERIAAVNKIDVVHPKTALLPMLATLVDDWGFAEAVPVSALTGEGCDRLLERIVARLPEGDPAYGEDFLTDQSERSLVGEFVREKLLRATRDELPHAIAVMVRHWREREDGLLEVAVEIAVERESQKAIVIGRSGEVLKRVGTEAREELERLLGRRLYLELHVVVRRGWRDDERALREFGLS